MRSWPLGVRMALAASSSRDSRRSTRAGRAERTGPGTEHLPVLVGFNDGRTVHEGRARRGYGRYRTGGRGRDSFSKRRDASAKMQECQDAKGEGEKVMVVEPFSFLGVLAL